MRFIFILLLSIPLIELYFLLQVGDVIGGFNTIILIIATAMLGSYFIRQQGVSTILKAQQNMQQGQLPAMELIEGFILVIAGVMLVTPGFITDALGFVMIVPVVRQVFIARVAAKYIQSMKGGSGQSPFNQNNASPSDFIEGEFTEEDDSAKINKDNN